MATSTELTQARERYVAAARECWAAWKTYAALGGIGETLSYARFHLPAPDGHARTDSGSLVDPERD